MTIWKSLFALLGVNFLTGGALLDGRKGGIGCGWVVIFMIVFFPFWLIYKMLKLIFRR
ncbi:MAG: hypothetical protein K2J65_01245 [Duncaniella sp.]|nr:hypothetical protein [Duncaniella sp.]